MDESKLPTWWPSAKVAAAIVASLLGSTAVAIADDGIPTDLVGWLILAAKVLAPTGAVGGAGWIRSETRPSRSAAETIANQGGLARFMGLRG